MQHNFHGQRVLIAEDDYLVAMELANEFSMANAQVLGPCSSLEEAIRCAATSEMAVLDVDLKGQMVFPLADRLMKDGIPFLFYSGYDRALLPARFADVPCVNKPLSPQTTVQVLARSRLADPQTISDLVPDLRQRARRLVHNHHAADRLLELTLRKAIADPDPLPPMARMKPWLEQMMLGVVREQGGRLLH